VVPIRATTIYWEGGRFQNALSPIPSNHWGAYIRCAEKAYHPTIRPLRARRDSPIFMRVQRTHMRFSQCLCGVQVCYDHAPAGEYT